MPLSADNVEKPIEASPPCVNSPGPVLKQSHVGRSVSQRVSADQPASLLSAPDVSASFPPSVCGVASPLLPLQVSTQVRQRPLEKSKVSACYWCVVVRYRACVNVVSINWLSLFAPPPPLPLSFPSFFLSQFPSSTPLVPPGGLKPSLFPLGPLPCAYSGGGGPAVSSPRYSPSLHQPSLPLTPHSVYSPTVPLLASPQTPQHVPSVALPPPLLAVASSPTGPQANLASLHAAHPLAVPQAHPNTYFAPYPAQEVAELPVQVNICHSLLASGAICVFVCVARRRR